MDVPKQIHRACSARDEDGYISPISKGNRIEHAHYAGIYSNNLTILGLDKGEIANENC